MFEQLSWSIFKNKSSKYNSVAPHTLISLEKFTQTATRAISIAEEESRRLRHDYIGTEHILLGIIGEDTSITGNVLRSMGVNLDNAQIEIENIIGYGRGTPLGRISFSPKAQRVLKYASDASRQLQQTHIGTEHLLLGLIREGRGLALIILKKLGVNLQRLEQQILELIKQQQTNSLKVLPPAKNKTLDLRSGEIAARLCAFLLSWVEPRKLGRILTASRGFKLHNQNLVNPDVSFISKEQLKQSPDTYTKIVPELVVEIKSDNDELMNLKEQIQKWLKLGARLVLLIDPEKRTVTMHRLNGEMKVLTDGDLLTIPDLFPGWELPIVKIWPPIFD